MRHLIACFHVRLVRMVTAPTKHFASHIHRAMRMIHSCVEQASIMLRLVNGLVHPEVVANVLLVNHALPTQHAGQQNQGKSPKSQVSLLLYAKKPKKPEADEITTSMDATSDSVQQTKIWEQAQPAPEKG